MQARMKNPVAVLPGALQAIQALMAATAKGGAAPATLNLVHLRVSQLNGCGLCVDSGASHSRKAGETDQRLFAVAAWRDTPYFSEAERAALALCEAMTRMSDRDDAVPDAIWEEAARHYDEQAIAALVMHTAIANLFNRLNVTTRQVAGSGW